MPGTVAAGLVAVRGAYSGFSSSRSRGGGYAQPVETEPGAWKKHLTEGDEKKHNLCSKIIRGAAVTATAAAITAAFAPIVGPMALVAGAIGLITSGSVGATASIERSTIKTAAEIRAVRSLLYNKPLI